MSRTRSETVAESRDVLLALQRRFAGTTTRIRIDALIALKNQPETTYDSIAAELGVSSRTVKRWWALYRERGLAGLVGAEAGRIATEDQARERSERERFELFRGDFEAGHMRSLEDVRAWLAERAPELDRRRGGPGSSIDAAWSLNERTVAFLNALPTDCEPLPWVEAVRAGLVGLFDDVDRVSVSVNFACRINDVNANAKLIAIVMQCPGTGNLYVRDIPADDSEIDPHIRRLLDNMAEQNFPFRDYHPPVAFAYYFGDVGYLGSIFLWRDVRRSPISDETRSAMESLRGFFVFLLTDYVARAGYARPEHLESIGTIDHLVWAYRLTRQERRLLLLLALGMSYKEMAETMNVSVNTLRYHRRSLYRKAGVHSHNELLAKIFSPKVVR